MPRSVPLKGWVTKEAPLSAPDASLATPDEERVLVTGLKRGDRAAAARLYELYGDKLFRQAILPRLPVRELAEDVLKDTFRLTLERIGQYQPQGRSIFFWMRRIAINRAIDVYRAYTKARRQQDDDRIADTIDRTMSQPPPAPDRSVEVSDTKREVELSLSRLNERYARALRLRLIEERPRQECAEVLGVTVGNFDVILHRAAKAFRKHYPP